MFEVDLFELKDIRCLCVLDSFVHLTFIQHAPVALWYLTFYFPTILITRIYSTATTFALAFHLKGLTGL
jgi:hypothetical protein